MKLYVFVSCKKVKYKKMIQWFWSARWWMPEAWSRDSICPRHSTDDKWKAKEERGWVNIHTKYFTGFFKKNG